MLAQIIELLTLIVCSVLLVIYYSDTEVKLYVKILVAISWSLSFLILLILPLDISYTLKDEELTTIKTIWTTIYYVNFVFTWLILPIAQQYQNAGEFTWKGRLKRSLIDNGIILLVFLVFGVLLMIYLILAGQFQFGLLPSVLATIANLFGIILVIIFLGHGLISLPKSCYLRTQSSKLMSHNYKTAGLINSKIQDLKFQTDIQIRKLRHLQSTGDYLVIGLATQILENTPEDIKSNSKINSKAFDLMDIQNPSEAKMIQLSQNLKKKVRQLRMNQSWLEDILQDTKNVMRQVKKNNYLYMKVIYSVLLVVTTLLSIILFLGEMSSFIPTLEKANVLIYIDEARSAVSYTLNTLFLLYMTYIITHSVFEMNVFGVFSLHKRHSTAGSMLFMSVNLARISYPLCYNYLQITGMPPIAFLDFFGDIHIGDEHVYIFPILLISFGVFNLLNIYDRLMGCLGLGRFAFSEGDADTQEEGKKVLEQMIEKSGQNSQILSNVASKSKSKSKDGDYLQLGRF